MRCFRLYRLLIQASLSSYWFDFNHLAYRSAVRNVLANFLRLSKFSSLVNFFFLTFFQAAYFAHYLKTIVRTAQTSQNIVTIKI